MAVDIEKGRRGGGAEALATDKGIQRMPPLAKLKGASDPTPLFCCLPGWTKRHDMGFIPNAVLFLHVLSYVLGPTPRSALLLLLHPSKIPQRWRNKCRRRH